MTGAGNAVTQAIILAAGRGERFRPVTDTLPKPLVEVGGKALIDWQIEQLLLNNVTKIVVNVCYLKEQLIAHLGKWQDMLEIIISEEGAALETGGGIKQALPHFGDKPFFAVNSDVIMYPLRADLLQQLTHALTVKPEASLVLLLQFTTHMVGLAHRGDFFCDKYGVLQRRGDFERAPFTFTGVQLIRPEVFGGEEASIFSMNKIYDKLIPGHDEIIGIINNAGTLLHIGDTNGHAEVEQFLNATKSQQQ